MSDSTSSPSPAPTPDPPPPQVNQGVISQVVGAIFGNSNQGALAAGVQGAQDAANKTAGNIGSIIQDATHKLSQLITPNTPNADPTQLAKTANDLGTTTAQATATAGGVGAIVAGSDAMHAARQAKDDAAAVNQLHLNPDDPAAIAQRTEIGNSAKQITEANTKIDQMQQVGLLDSPISWLGNHLIGIPMAELDRDRATERLQTTANAQGIQTKALANATVADAAINSKDTVDRANLVATQQLYQAKAAGAQVQLDALRTQMGAWQLGEQMKQTGIAAAHLALAQQLAPGQLRAQEATAEYYGPAKESLILKNKADAEFLDQKAAQGKLETAQAANYLSNGQAVVTMLGGDGTKINDIKQLNPALRYMTSTFATTGSLGAGPAEAVEALTKSGFPATGLAAGGALTADGIEKIRAQVTNEVAQSNATGLAKYTPAQSADIINQTVNNRIMAEQNHITPDNKFFAPPGIQTVIDNPKYKDNPIIAGMRPISVDGAGNKLNRPIDGTLLMNTAAGLVQSGKLTLPQASAALKEVTTNFLDDRQAGGLFKAFAIPVRQQYPMPYNRIGGLVGNRINTVDYMDSAATQKALLGQVSALKAAQLQKDIGNNLAGAFTP